MWIYREFKHVVAARMELMPLFSVYSRIEMAVDEKNDIIVILLRTKPQMSQWMFEAPPYCYPQELFVHTNRIYRRCVVDYVDEGVMVPGISEVVAPSYLEVPAENLPITAELESALYRVPEVDWSQPFDQEMAAYDPSMYWAAVLMEAATKSQARPAGVPELCIVHAPDTPLESCTEAQLNQLTALATGWNYMNMFQAAGQEAPGATFLLGAAESAEVIVQYP